jgi:RNA polymerase-binding transcription factor DksA
VVPGDRLVQGECLFQVPVQEGEDGRRDADFEDVASFLQADEVLEGLDEAGRAEIGEIRAAFERIAAGTWGVCESCGQDIASKRLAVLPHARLCVACAAAADA